jgi:hypothetical protein
MIGKLVASKGGRWLALPLALGLGYHVPEMLWPPRTDQAAVQALTQGRAGERKEFDLTVKSGTTLSSGLTLLNDRENFREPGTLCVVCDQRLLPQGTDGRQLVGKTVHVIGHATTYKGNPQVRATSLTLK